MSSIYNGGSFDLKCAGENDQGLYFRACDDPSEVEVSTFTGDAYFYFSEASLRELHAELGDLFVQLDQWRARVGASR